MNPSLEEISGVALICAGILGFASGSPRPAATCSPWPTRRDRGVYAPRRQGGRAPSGAPVSYTLWFFVANGIVITAVGLAQRGREVPAYLAGTGRAPPLGGACSLAAYGIRAVAMNQGADALVAGAEGDVGDLRRGHRRAAAEGKFTRWRLFATGAVMLGLVALRL